ncbi:bifunctional diaminohydroxyphosphoribosylaminopyrimidine deaminase/5-amino-6-(5-phosphoribosylamino)uracil reductase RibD [Rubrobacter tropicus]|uniref:Riboflavin biosynthesis protein RibD n=1 Tax=Rubrobacter tropicus TaxID=2653851 RepID=A0A6G8Q8X4_9ACTN|nr:bifunctional diaminohydroxyphosphoribosylaminopyrimidine deaminase/5-amino-6-(5-phosphoribosylamino)uracil reductase RibD [Rubrobacter tropicus]QIN82926.1 bifunctional diaminohydroxyphosphoribosylaminopyrimidine deaminase/5-amino-6-(5-phosphoribosylamino)uracil reductase RibD [Rubrobacter tropicus]
MARGSFEDLARRLAERGRFTVAPNPLVGAVAVRGDAVVGEGWHARAGEDHAEVRALKAAGGAAAGATLFVTLEPCNHHGRTPPCVEAIRQAGVSRVVVGALDPDPRMRGRSVEMLRDAGIEVEVVGDPACELQNEQFFHRMRTGRPFVHVKLATTLDGRIAAPGGDSKWVTGEAARLRAHALRAEAGAVLVGAGTVRADDPTLTARGLPEVPPAVTRAVLDPRLTTSPESKLARTASDSPVVVFAASESLDGRERALLKAGCEVVEAPANGGTLDLLYILDELGRRGVKGVLVEGGGETATGFVERGLADKLTLFYAPKLMGSEGVPMIGTLRATKMAEALRFRVSGVEAVGEDVAVTLYPARSEEEKRVHRAC